MYSTAPAEPVMSLHALLWLVGIVSAPPAIDAANTSCPAASPRQTAYVRQFFAAQESRAFREQHGLLGVRPGDVRALTDEQDAEACQRMSRAVTLRQAEPHLKVWRGYRAGAYYVMAVTTERPRGSLEHGGGTGLIVLDANMRVVAAAS
jgi:hypothetical protein